jgi:DNA-directed RNA polymerase specialized sigma subunit
MSDPLEDYKQSKEAEKAKRKKNELDLWQRWMDNGKKPEHLKPLLKLYEPVLAQKARQFRAKTVPESAFKAELQKHLINALEVYDPNRGAAINTHVENRLRKAMRYNNRYQNVAYIPEGQSGLIGALQRAQSELGEQLGREPTVNELSEHLGETPKRISTVLKAVKRDVPMSRSGGENYDYSGGEHTGRQFEEQQIAVAQNILPEIFPNKPHLHATFNYVFGTNGYPKITHNGELAKKLGTTEQNSARWKTIVGDTLKKHMGLNAEEDKD